MTITVRTVTGDKAKFEGKIIIPVPLNGITKKLKVSVICLKVSAIPKGKERLLSSKQDQNSPHRLFSQNYGYVPLHLQVSYCLCGAEHHYQPDMLFAIQ